MGSWASRFGDVKWVNKQHRQCCLSKLQHEFVHCGWECCSGGAGIVLQVVGVRGGRACGSSDGLGIQPYRTVERVKAVNLL